MKFNYVFIVLLVNGFFLLVFSGVLLFLIWERLFCFTRENVEGFFSLFVFYLVVVGCVFCGVIVRFVIYKMCLYLVLEFAVG